MVVKSLNLYLYYFLKLNCFSVFVPVSCIGTIFCICTDPLCQHYFPVFVPISGIDTVFLHYDTQ